MFVLKSSLIIFHKDYCLTTLDELQEPRGFNIRIWFYLKENKIKAFQRCLYLLEINMISDLCIPVLRKHWHGQWRDHRWSHLIDHLRQAQCLIKHWGSIPAQHPADQTQARTINTGEKTATSDVITCTWSLNLSM